MNNAVMQVWHAVKQAKLASFLKGFNTWEQWCNVCIQESQ